MIDVCRSYATLLAVVVGTAVQAAVLKPRCVEVVTATNTTPTVRYAVREMTNFLARALGAPVPVTTQPTPARTHVFLGGGEWTKTLGLDCATLPRDAFRVHVTGEGVYLLGRDDSKADPFSFERGDLRYFAERATLFAVYDFLERYVGCRFFFPGELGTVVPRVSEVVVPDDDRVVVPDSDERRYTRDVVECGTWYDPAVDRRVLHGVAWMRWRLATATIPCCHGQRQFHYVARFAKDHPDWFCLGRDGKRILRDTGCEPHYANNKFCYSSPIREEIYQDVKACLSGRPAAERGLQSWPGSMRGGFVDVMPEDGFSECHCPKCQVVFDRTCGGKNHGGNYANDLIWELTAEIGRRLKADGVKGYITQMAYSPYGEVPTFDLPNNIQVMVAAHGPWDVAKPESFAKSVARIKAWHEKTGNRVWLWTYPGNYYGDYKNIPVVCPRAWAKFYQTVQPHARFGFAENMCDRFAYDLLNLYVFSRLAWDPKQNVEDIIDDYHTKLFGAAGTSMKRVFDLLEEKWMSICAGGSVMTAIGPKPVKTTEVKLFTDVYTAAFFAEVDRLFADAKRAVSSDSREGRCVEMFRGELIEPLRRAKARLNPAAELARRARANPVNLLKNADFAEGIRHWQTKTPKAPPAFDSSDKVTGAACCVLNGIGAEPPHYYTSASLLQSPVPVKKGCTYRLSYFLKCKNVVLTERAEWHGAGAGGCVWLPNEKYFKFPTPMSVGTHDWVHMCHLVAPQDDGMISVEFRLVHSTGEMRVCGVLFEEWPAASE